MKGLETLERFRIDVTDHVATLTITDTRKNWR